MKKYKVLRNIYDDFVVVYYDLDGNPVRRSAPYLHRPVFTFPYHAHDLATIVDIGVFKEINSVNSEEEFQLLYPEFYI